MDDRVISTAIGMYVMHMANAQGHYTFGGMRVFAMKLARLTSNDEVAIAEWVKSAIIGMGIIAHNQDAETIAKAKSMLEANSGLFVRDLEKSREEHEIYISSVVRSKAYKVMESVMQKKQRYFC